MQFGSSKSFFGGFLLVVISTILSLTIAEIIAEKKVSTTSLPQTIPPTSFRFIPAERPEISYSLSPNASLVVLGIPFTTNELGLREDSFLPKSDQLFRILCLGDSVTFGSGVPTENTFPRVLESRLQARATPSIKIDVINAGVAGYSFQNIVAFAENLITRLQPEVVIYTFVENDLDDSYSAGPGGALIEMDLLKPPDSSFINDEFALRWRQRNPSRQKNNSKFAIYKLATNIINPFPDNFLPLINGTEPESQRRWQQFEKRMQTLKTLCESQGAKLALFQFGMRNRSELTHRFLQRLCENNSLPFASTLPLFSTGTYAALYSLVYDPHPNTEAHRLIAERLDCFLQEQGVLPEGFIQQDKGGHSYNETIDPAMEQEIEKIVEDMPTEINFRTGDGIVGVLGGIGKGGQMARTCLFRMGGSGHQLVVEAKALLTHSNQEYTLSARIQDSTPSEPIYVSSTWTTLTFDIPPGLENQVIEVEFIAGGPAFIPTLVEREKGGFPVTLALRRITRNSNSPVP